jgi:hypothetical protein
MAIYDGINMVLAAFCDGVDGPGGVFNNDISMGEGLEHC